MMSETLLRLWHVGGQISSPLLRLHLRHRARQGKEDATRLGERLGHPSLPRPRGLLLWLHAASVGESLSALPLIEGLRRVRPDVEILVTSGTVTSAQLLTTRLNEGSAHQYAPIDTPATVRRFLDYWQPDAVVLVESELWPGYVTALAERQIPLALVSARLSERSARRWGGIGKPGKALFARVRLILAQSADMAARFVLAGADPSQVMVGGPLKEVAQPLPVDPDALRHLRAHLNTRPRWLAASTHAGEETAAFEAHEALRARWPQMLTLLAPRHPDRAADLANQARARGLRVALRSETEWPPADVDVFIIDRLGELGLWYRVSPIAFIGGTLVPVGGHNPLEAARLGCAVIHGPYVRNALDAYNKLGSFGATLAMGLGETPAGAVASLLTPQGEPNERAQRMAEAGFEATAGGMETLLRTVEAVNTLLPAPDPSHDQRPGRHPPRQG